MLALLLRVGDVAAMKTNQPMKKAYDPEIEGPLPEGIKETEDPTIELAASDFFRRLAREGRPRERGMSMRMEDLIIVFGVPLIAGFYEVYKLQSGEECVRLLEHPSEEDIARLCGD